MRRKVFPKGRVMKAPKDRTDSYFIETIPEGEYALTIKASKSSVRNSWVKWENLSNFTDLFRTIDAAYENTGQPELDMRAIEEPGRLSVAWLQDDLHNKHRPKDECIICGKNEYCSTEQNQELILVSLSNEVRNGSWIHARCAGEFVSLLEDIPHKIDTAEVFVQHI